MKKQRFVIQEMHCTSCAMIIDGTLEELPGVKEANTSFARGRTEVVFDPYQISVEQLVAAVQEAGYTIKAEA
jgi:copper chaperone